MSGKPWPRIPAWALATLWLGWVAGCGGASPAQAQGVASPPPSTLAPPEGTALPTLPAGSLTPAVPDNYLLGPDDLLAVSVLGMPDLTTLVRVNSAGQFSLPLLPRPIDAGNRTAPQVSEDLSAALTREGLAVHPEVRVTVQQVQSKPVVVTGAVRTPTVVQAARPMDLVEALSRAGGVTAAGGGDVVVTQDGKDTSYDLNALLNSASPPPTPLLRGGETVRVLPARLVYAIGALQKPGAFPITTGEPVSVLRAVALAEGLSQTEPADREHTEIFRTASDGSRQVIAVNLEAILRHKAADLHLQPGDILYVPENGRQRFVRALFQDAGQAAVIALGYSTHY